jgi:hypothetical protein
VLGAGDRRIAAVAVACPMEELYFVVGRHRSVHRSQQILPLPPPRRKFHTGCAVFYQCMKFHIPIT